MYASTEQRNREQIQALADQLYRERFHYLRQIALRNGAAADAVDVVNDAFAAFIDKFDPASGSPPLGLADPEAPLLGDQPWPPSRSPGRPLGRPGFRRAALL